MRCRTRAGFTLVEAMIVVAIIAIMLAVSAPALLAALPGLRVNGAARQMLSDLRLARTMTVEKGDWVVAQFHVDQTGNPATGLYVLAYDLNQNNQFDAGTDEFIKEVDLPSEYSTIQVASNVGGTPADGVNLDTGVANTVTFRTNGSATESGEVYLAPAADSGTTRTDRNRRVRLIGATGNLRIETYEGGTWQ